MQPRFTAPAAASALLLLLSPTLSAQDRVAPAGTAADDLHGSVLQFGSTYVFRYAPPQEDRIEYAVDTSDADVDAGLVEIGARFKPRAAPPGAIFHPVMNGGVRLRRAAGIDEPTDWASAGALTNVALNGGELTLTYDDSITGATRTHTFSLDGNVLKLVIEDTDQTGTRPSLDYYAGFSPGVSDNTPGVRDFEVTYARYPVAGFRQGDADLFYGAYVDPSDSSCLVHEPYRSAVSASSFGVGNYSENIPDYRTDTSGQQVEGHVAPFHETVYISVSDDVVDCLPRAFRPAGERDDLVGTVFFDIGAQTGWYEPFAGVEVTWTAPTAGAATTDGEYRVAWASSFNVISSPLLDCTNGDLLRFEVLLNEDRIFEDFFRSDGHLEPDPRTWDIDLSNLAAGDRVRFRLDTMGFSPCDVLMLVPRVTLDGITYDAYEDFFTIDPEEEDPIWELSEYFRDASVELDAVHPDPEVAPQTGWTSPRFGIIERFDSVPLGLHTLLLHPPFYAYPSAEKWYERLADSGMEDLAVIYHVWQRYGFDVELPIVFPPNEAFGTVPMFWSMTDAAQALGYFMSIHLNVNIMNDLDPTDSNDYLIDDFYIAKDTNGMPKMAGDSSITALDKMDDVLFDLAQEIPDVNELNASYIDAITSADPEDYVDMDAGNPTPKTGAAAFQSLAELFATSDAEISPILFGEGGDHPFTLNDTFMAGIVDSVQRQVVGRVQSPLMPDFELRSVRPLMANTGMGLYGRYFPPTTGGGHAAPSKAEIDRYRLQTLAYGHSGFMGDTLQAEIAQPVKLAHLMRYYADEYYQNRAVQEKTLDAADPIESVLYAFPDDPADFMTLSRALATGENMNAAKVKVAFESGLTIWANFDDGRIPVYSLLEFPDVESEHTNNGWFHEEAGVPMAYNTFTNRFEGTEPFAFFERALASPRDEPIARVYRFPQAGTYTVRVNAHDVVPDTEPVVADGVTLTIDHLSYHDEIDIVDGAPQIDWIESEFTLTVAQGDELRFELDSKDNSVSDLTYLTVAIEEVGPDPEWTVDVFSGLTLHLPAYGYVVADPDDEVLVSFYAATASGADPFHYVFAPVDSEPETDDYVYLRATEDGASTSFSWPTTGPAVGDGSIQTDGSAALKRKDLAGVGEVIDAHLFQGTELSIPGAAEPTVISLSRRATLQVIYEDPKTLVLKPDFPTSGIDEDQKFLKLNITYPNVPSGMWTFIGSIAKRPAVFEVDPIDGTKTTHHSFSITQQGGLTISQARAGWTYRVEF